MKLRVKYGTWMVPPGYYGWVIYPFMLFRPSKDEVTDIQFRHELQHVYQVREHGWLKFYITWAWYSITRGYDNNPYEIEAYAREHEELTKDERDWREA
jgi:hypothetical protein